MAKLLTKKLQETVREILTLNPEARDCDRMLTAMVWSQEMRLELNTKPEATTEFKSRYVNWYLAQFLNNYARGKYTLADSITRARRKLQEEDKTLRGKNWYKRKGRAEEVRQEFINFKYQ